MPEQILPPLAQQAKRHWKEFQPTMYKHLLAEGTLDQTLIELEQHTQDEMDQLEQAGFHDYEAREIVYPKYLFLPDENEDEDIPKGVRPDLDNLQEGHRLLRKAQEEM